MDLEDMSGHSDDLLIGIAGLLAANGAVTIPLLQDSLWNTRFPCSRINRIRGKEKERKKRRKVEREREGRRENPSKRCLFSIFGSRNQRLGQNSGQGTVWISAENLGMANHNVLDCFPIIFSLPPPSLPPPKKIPFMYHFEKKIDLR